MKKTLLTLALVAVSTAATFAQGTIQFLNTSLQRLQYQDQIGGPITTAPAGLHIGVFWGTDQAAVDAKGGGTLSLPTTLTLAGGLFDRGVAYQIPDTQPGQRIWMKIAGWAGGSDTSLAGHTHYGQSATVNVALGPTTGPGTVVFQSPAGVHTERGKPFVIVPIPEPSVIALGALGLGALLLRRRRA